MKDFIISIILLACLLMCSKSTLIDFPETRSGYEEEYEIRDTVEVRDTVTGIPIEFDVTVED